MSPSKHIVASGMISAAFAGYTHSWDGTMACFLSGIFIDLDHIIDFWIAKKRFPRQYRDLYSFCANEKAGKLHLVFHSYELLAVLWFLCFFSKWNPVWLGITIGMTLHIIFDALTNSLKPFVYFMIYRIKHNFSKAAAFPEEDYEKLI